MGLYQWTGPFLRLLSPEDAHTIAIKALKWGLVPASKPVVDPILKQTIWDIEFPNPIGLAAGFDKNADVADAMLKQGFGYVEIGSVTPKAQPGNAKPRLFRLTEDLAVVNRMGFNNEGMDAVVKKMKARKGVGVVGANLGKNKTQEDAIADYVAGIKAFAPYSDYLVINVSSPNTPGLRALQSKDQLAELLNAVIAARGNHKVPVLLKVAPDLTDEDKTDIADVALQAAINGLIISNTTIERSELLRNHQKSEGGGLSGRPLFEPSTQVLREFAGLLKGNMPLIGVGGIFSADDAYSKILAGASLVQLYSALVYEGPTLANTINKGLVERLKADGFANISDAVGKGL